MIDKASSPDNLAADQITPSEFIYYIISSYFDNCQ